ncbi:MAG: hypothetical protein V4532_12560, partial [Pseudomonadota bacterium]
MKRALIRIRSAASMLGSACVLGLVSLVSPRAQAADLGTIGPTYAISEPNLLAFIAQRLQDK